MWTVRSVLKETLRRIKRFLPLLSKEERFSFCPVDPGKLYRSAQPDKKTLSYFIKKYRLRSVIVLTEHYDRQEKELVQSMGLIFTHIPLRTEMPPDDEQANSFLFFLSNSGNLPALVHCIQGRDRTGCLCFLYRVEQMGWSTEMAYHEMRNLGFESLPKHIRTQRYIKGWLEKRYGIKFSLYG